MNNNHSRMTDVITSKGTVKSKMNDIDYNIIITKGTVNQKMVETNNSKFLTKLSDFLYEKKLKENFFKLYGLIMRLCKCTEKNYKNGGYWCFAHNEYFANKMHLSVSRIRSMLKVLEDIGLIKRIQETNPKTKVFERKIYALFLHIEVKINDEPDLKETDKKSDSVCEDCCRDENDKNEEKKFFEPKKVTPAIIFNQGGAQKQSPPHDVVTHENIDAEAPQKGSSLNTKPKYKPKENIKTTTTIRKHAQNFRSEKVAVAESDFFIKNEKSLNSKTQKEKNVQKNSPKSEKEASKDILSCNEKTTDSRKKSKNQLYKISLLYNAKTEYVRCIQKLAA